MFNRRKKDKKRLGPVMAIMILIVIIVLASAVFSILGITGRRTVIVNGDLETSTLSLNQSILSGLEK